jgi:hypothetical protein
MSRAEVFLVIGMAQMGLGLTLGLTAVLFGIGTLVFGWILA